MLSRPRFYQRLAVQLGICLLLLTASILIGMAGYMGLEGLSAIDAFLNVAMLLGGMGPVNPPMSFAGKLFAGVFALYAGLLFIVCAALVLTPVIHRVLHHFHLQKN